jgi:hypothetical protein
MQEKNCHCLRLVERVKRSNLALFEEIAAHLSGARNDTCIRRLKKLSLKFPLKKGGIYIFQPPLIIPAVFSRTYLLLLRAAITRRGRSIIAASAKAVGAFCLAPNEQPPPPPCLSAGVVADISGVVEKDSAMLL